MANIKFSAFTQKVALGDVDFLVGYTGADNVRVAPSVLSSIYLPLAGGTMTGDLLVTTTGGYFQVDVSDNSVKFADNTTAKFGTGNDLKIYHNGTNSIIENITGNLILQNNLDDKDIIFKSDDGSGGITEYFRVDGDVENIRFSKDAKFSDNVKALFGGSADLEIYHDTSNSVINNKTGHLQIYNNANDGDISFISDDGSGGTATYFYLDGSSVTTVVSKEFKFEDNVKANFGTGVDLQIYHDASNSYIKQGGTGDLYIQQHTDDKDIIFQSDNGSGGIATYFYLDGSQATGSLFTKFPDNSIISLGDSSDCYIRHDGTDTRIDNSSGNLKFKNSQADGDIIFEADDGAGGVETYFQLDGGNTNIKFSKDLYLLDNVKARIGTGSDLQIYHNASNSIVENFVGDLILRNSANDKDIIFESDDGGGGTTEDFRVDGSGVTITVSAGNGMVFFDNIKAKFGNTDDLQIYHDGSHSYIDSAGTGDLYVMSSSDDVVIQAADDVYIYTEGGENSIICENNAGVKLYYNNSKKFETTSTGTKTTGQMDIAALNTAPASASATGTLGEIRYTADYIYVCTATNTWKRSALSTW